MVLVAVLRAHRPATKLLLAFGLVIMHSRATLGIGTEFHTRSIYVYIYILAPAKALNKDGCTSCPPEELAVVDVFATIAKVSQRMCPHDSGLPELCGSKPARGVCLALLGTEQGMWW